eukprot:Opistho-2@35213
MNCWSRKTPSWCSRTGESPSIIAMRRSDTLPARTPLPPRGFNSSLKDGCSFITIAGAVDPQVPMSPVVPSASSAPFATPTRRTATLKQMTINENADGTLKYAWCTLCLTCLGIILGGLGCGVLATTTEHSDCTRSRPGQSDRTAASLFHVIIALIQASDDYYIFTQLLMHTTEAVLLEVVLSEVCVFGLPHVLCVD